MQVGISARMHSGIFFFFQNSYQREEIKRFNTCLILLKLPSFPSYEDPKHTLPLQDSSYNLMKKERSPAAYCSFFHPSACN